MRRIDQIEPFRVMQLLERARELEAEGRSIIHMEVGEPDFTTPEPILAAARKRLETGGNFYTPSSGLPELQRALADWYQREYGITVAPERILITPGTSGAFSLIYAALIEPGELAAIARTCRDKGGYLISDEIYHGLTYGTEAPTALQFDDHAIVVNGFSKRWAMTGWRIGWIVVPEALIAPCRRVMQNIFISAPTLSQYAAIAALDTDAEVESMRQAYDARRQYLLAELPKLGFRIVVEPKGAFYIYADVEQLTDDSKSFCWLLLDQIGVAVTPGEDFGHFRPEKHVRFSYANSLENLHEGVRRIAGFVQP